MTTTLGILCPPTTPLPLPPRGVRAGRLVDLLRVLKVADYDVWRHPELVVAAAALLHRVPRVLLATEPAPLMAAHTFGARDAVLVADLETAARLEAAGGDTTDRPALFAPATFEPAASARAPGSRVYPTLGAGQVLLPQHPRLVPIPGAALAAILYTSGAPTLLPTVEYAPPPDLPAVLEDLGELGLLLLRRIGPSRRVGRGPGFPRPPRPEPDAGPTLEASTGSTIAPGAADGTPPLPPELLPLRAALAALCERSSHRLALDESGARTLEREAKKLLQTEVVAGRIKGWALAVVPIGPIGPGAPGDQRDDVTDLGLEVVVTLPRRVGQVILRLAPMTARPDR